MAALHQRTQRAERRIIEVRKVISPVLSVSVSGCGGFTTGGVNLDGKWRRYWFTRTFRGVEHRSSCGIIEDHRIYGRSIQKNDSCFPIYFYLMPLNCTSIYFVQKQTASPWWSPQFSRRQLAQVAPKRPAASIVVTSVPLLICPVVVDPYGCNCRYAAGTVPILPVRALLFLSGYRPSWHRQPAGPCGWRKNRVPSALL